MTRTSDDIHDEWLVLAAQTGDAAAFETLVRRRLPAMARHAHRLTGDREAAADVTQDACLAIVRGLGRLEDPATFDAWVRRIVANKAADWIRRRRRQRRVEQALALDGVRAQQPEIVRLVRQALRVLPRHLQSVVSLRYGEGRSVNETAAVLGVPTGTVKSRLHAARHRLKDFIYGGGTHGAQSR